MELYAVKYGESQFPVKNIYDDLSQSNERLEFLWLFYVAKYNDKVLLFDTGFREAYTSKKWGVELKAYEKELCTIIQGFDSVDVVFITHSHFDHIGNLDLYKNATTIISTSDYENAITDGERAISKKLTIGNTVIVEKEFLFDHKFSFQVIGGHSKGSSVIYFTHDSNTYVITGDECYVCDNMLSTRPVGVYTDIEKNREFLSDGHDKGMIPLPMHDTKIFENYERVSENIVKIL